MLERGEIRVGRHCGLDRLGKRERARRVRVPGDYRCASDDCSRGKTRSGQQASIVHRHGNPFVNMARSSLRVRAPCADDLRSAGQDGW